MWLIASLVPHCESVTLKVAHMLGVM